MVTTLHDQPRSDVSRGRAVDAPAIDKPIPRCAVGISLRVLIHAASLDLREGKGSPYWFVIEKRGMAMSIPVWVLLAFAVWTMLVLTLTVGIYRWGLVFAGRAQVNEFRADQVEGSDWYRRSMRAHLNCVENLPVYGAIVLVLVVSGAGSPLLDILALTLISARVVQTLIHVSWEQTNVLASLRFLFFFVQLICMLWMAALIVQHAI